MLTSFNLSAFIIPTRYTFHNEKMRLVTFFTAKNAICRTVLTNLILCLTFDIVHKLPCASAGHIAVTYLPCIGFFMKLLSVHSNSLSFGQLVYDSVELVLRRLAVVNLNAKPVCKAQLFFHTVASVKLSRMLHIVSVIPRFLDKVSSI